MQQVADSQQPNSRACSKSAWKRSDKRFSFTLGPLIIATCFCSALTHLLVAATLISNVHNDSTFDISFNATRPYAYTRLRYDTCFLPIERNIQKPKVHLEKELRLYVNDSELYGGNRTIKYFTNPHLELGSISEDDLILEALDQTYLTILLHPNMQDFDRPGDRKLAADPAKVSKKRCRRELGYLMDQLSNVESARSQGGQGRGLSADLSSFFDAFGTEEAGLLFGHNNWPGNWRQCSRRHIFDPNYDRGKPEKGVHNGPISFTGRHCIASIRSPSWDKKVKEKLAELNKTYFRYPGQTDEYRKYHRIQLGICLPESCDSTLVEDKELYSDLRRLALHRLREPLASYEITELFCLPDPGSPLTKIDLSGWILLVVSALWLLALLAATLADRYDLTGMRKKKPSQAHPIRGAKRPLKPVSQRLVVSLSMLESWKRLTEPGRRATKPKPIKRAVNKNGLELDVNNGEQVATCVPAASVASPNDLVFLDFIKVAIMPPIVVAHVGMLTLQLCRFPLDYEPTSPIWTHFQAGCTFYVDWYFAITGFITAYIAFTTRAVSENSGGNWLYSVFHRYWRLAPSYVLLFWFARSLFQHTGSGPLWDYGTSNWSGRGICKRESWIYPLTLTSNLHPLYDECIMPSWYISNDIQFYLITPFVLLLLRKSPKLGYLSSGLVMLLVIVARAHRYMTSKTVQPVELLRPRIDLVMRNNGDMYDTYLWPHYRVNAYLVGLLAGHYGYMVRSGQWSSPLYEWSRSGATSAGGGLPFSSGLRSCMAWLGLLMAIQMNMATLLMSDYMPAWVDAYARPVAAAIYSTDHTLAALGPSLMFLAILLGQWPLARKFMEHKLWVYPTRINFFVYLYQVELIIWLQSSGERMPDLTFWDEFRLLACLMPILYLISTLATLMLSTPLDRLEREFVGVHMTGRKRKQPDAAKRPHNLLASTSDAGSRQPHEPANCEATRLVTLNIGDPPESAEIQKSEAEAGQQRPPAE